MTEYIKYADKALSIYNTTYDSVMMKSEDGIIEVIIDKKKKKIMWSDVYVFTEEQYNEWKKYVIGDLKRKNPQLDGDSLNIIFTQIDMIYGLGQPYLFIPFIPQEQSFQSRNNLLDTPDY